MISILISFHPLYCSFISGFLWFHVRTGYGLSKRKPTHNPCCVFLTSRDAIHFGSRAILVNDHVLVDYQAFQHRKPLPMSFFQRFFTASDRCPRTTPTAGERSHPGTPGPKHRSESRDSEPQVQLRWCHCSGSVLQPLQTTATCQIPWLIDG